MLPPLDRVYGLTLQIRERSEVGVLEHSRGHPQILHPSSCYHVTWEERVVCLRSKQVLIRPCLYAKLEHT